MTVLLVDSPEAARKRLRTALEKVPGLLIVGEAHNHASAMRIFFEHGPDAVVVGVCLEDSSGFDVLISVRQADSRCPLILLGEGQDTFVEHVGRLLGANEVCYKDENLHYLHRLLHRLANQRRQSADIAPGKKAARS